MSDEGGGASRSTDPASGTSSATDVSLREFLSAVGWERLLRLETEISHSRELMKLHREADQTAIGKALDSAKELAEKHNDLIRAGEKKDENYATKADLNRLERWQSRMTGGFMVVAVIGIANLVKLWLDGPT